MNIIQNLILDVQTARSQYVDQISTITDVQARWKPEREVWNIIEITEHLFWAEQGGILGMWKSIHAIRAGAMVRTHESVHKDMPIKQVIDITWQPKEKVPLVAAPRFGGILSFWISSLKSLQPILVEFGEDLKENELRLQAHPHPISGALDFQQRIEFLRFHINRHEYQVSQLLASMKC